MHAQELLQAVYNHVKAAEEKRRDRWELEAPDFNACAFVAPNPKERILSDILANLLDPKKSHGQGSRFLTLFLEAIGAQWQDVKSATVSREQVIEEGQPDIVVEMPKGLVFIENKIDARDQPGQIDRYTKGCKAHAGLRPWKVVYVTPSGGEPTSVQDVEQHRASQQLCLMSYDVDIPKWLKRCRDQCKAARVSAFIDDLENYIDTVVLGKLPMEINEHVIDEATSSVERVEAAMEIIAAAEDIRSCLRSKLQAQLGGLLGPLARTVRTAEKDGDWTGFDVQLPDVREFRFCVQWYKGQLVYGLLREAEEPHPQELSGLEQELIPKLEAELGRGKQDQYWLWLLTANQSDAHVQVEGNWNTSAKPWVAIKDKDRKMAQQLAKVAKRIHEILLNATTTPPPAEPPSGPSFATLVTPPTAPATPTPPAVPCPGTGSAAPAAEPACAPPTDDAGIAPEASPPMASVPASAPPPGANQPPDVASPP